MPDPAREMVMERDAAIARIVELADPPRPEVYRRHVNTWPTERVMRWWQALEKDNYERPNKNDDGTGSRDGRRQTGPTSRTARFVDVVKTL